MSREAEEGDGGGRAAAEPVAGGGGGGAKGDTATGGAALGVRATRSVGRARREPNYSGGVALPLLGSAGERRTERWREARTEFPSVRQFPVARPWRAAGG
ncbi:MAG TPA: hypothetical protein VGR16_11505 [Thermomicrobiales bacterium]|nr:hypothetical protein [Thermomicrobiales bacterium]